MKNLSNSNVSESAKLHHGVTVIEVLTSMLVALIGVFGVLILIPFSVQQAQIGLDQDAAGVVADNAFEDLQIYGLTDVAPDGALNLRGVSVGLTSAGLTMPPFTVAPDNVEITDGNVTVPFGCYSTPLNNVLFSSLIHLDPIAISNVGIPTALGDNNPDFLTGLLPAETGTFTTRGANPNPVGPPLAVFHEDSDSTNRTLNPLRVVVATGASNTTFSPAVGVTVNEFLSVPEINRIFRTEDDIVTGMTNFVGTEVSDVELAQPLFDVSSQGNLVKRQVSGRISWSAVFQPIKDPTRVSTGADTPATRYKVYILVYGDRSVIPGDPDSQMLTAPVLRHTTIQNPNTLPSPQHGGYDPAVNQIILGPDITPVGVFKDDWVMLINRRPLAMGGVSATAPVGVFDPETGGTVPQQLRADEEAYRVQVSFAKVISVDSESDTVQGDSTVLHVDGGAFDFYYSDVNGATPTYGSPTYTSATYVVNLKNVLNVYERTITLNGQ